MTDSNIESIAKAQELGIVTIIPTYNNAKTLSTIIDNVLLFCKDVIVVNDGSTDETSDILSKKSGFTLISYEKNRGKGHALKLGLTKAKELNFHYAITIDSDGQHLATDIPIFLEAIQKTPDTLLVGARNLQANNMPGKNTFANKFSNFWFKLETGTTLNDTQSGFRLYPVQKLNHLNWYTNKYEFELEILVFSLWNDIPVRNIPINVYYPPQEERVSHFRPFADFSRISVLNTVLVLLTFLWIKPRNFFRKLTWTNIKAFFDRELIHTTDSNTKLALSVFVGAFCGIIPIWGYQLITAYLIARIFKLNRIVAIASSNVSLPPLIPFILYGSYVIGCLIFNQPINLIFSEISFKTVSNSLLYYVVGSIILALIVASILAFITWILLYIFRKKNG